MGGPPHPVTGPLKGARYLKRIAPFSLCGLHHKFRPAGLKLGGDLVPVLGYGAVGRRADGQVEHILKTKRGRYTDFAVLFQTHPHSKTRGHKTRQSLVGMGQSRIGLAELFREPQVDAGLVADLDLFRQRAIEMGRKTLDPDILGIP